MFGSSRDTSSLASFRSLSNWITGIPRRWASTFTGGGSRCLPRPAGLSGFVRTPTTVNRDAKAVSVGTAISGFPANRIRSWDRSMASSRLFSAFGTPIVRRNQLIARLLLHSIYEQNPIEVVVLVLNHSCEQSIGCKLERLASDILSLNGHSERSNDIVVHTGDTEAPLFVHTLLLTRLDYFRIDEHKPLSRPPSIHDEQSVQRTYLRGCKAYPIGFSHGLKHGIDKYRERIVENGYPFCLSAQYFFT